MKNITYINAGAGSGKTYKLTHLLPEYFTDEVNPIRPSQVIVTTFTRAAAAEIQQRAREVLLKEGKFDMVTELDTAAIGTIDSIAQRFIQKYWYVIGLVPGTTPIGSVESDTIRDHSLKVMMEDARFDQHKANFDAFAKEFGEKEDFWRDILTNAVKKLTSYNIHTVDDIAHGMAESFHIVGQIFNNAAQPSAAAFTTLLKEVKDWLKAQGKDEVKKLTLVSGNDLRYCQILKVRGTLNVKEDEAPDEICRHIKTLDAWLCSSYYSDIIKECIASLYATAIEWQKAFADYKRAHGFIDYDDMSQGFLELLKNEDIQQEIRNDYKLVMVDEFQDCNPIQIDIFQRLSHLVDSSVWVGDPNQAIFGFRGSNTELIEKLAAKFPAPEKGKDKDGLAQEELLESYRSRQELCDLAYDCFSQVFAHMNKLTSKTDIGEQNKSPIRCWHIYSKELKELARKVRELVKEEKTYIKPKRVNDEEQEERLVQYSDIAILVRTNKHAVEVADALRETGVPAMVPEMDIFQRAEVQLMLSLLRLSEKDNDHEWASLLRLWNGWSTEDILRDRMDYMAGGKDHEWIKDDEELAPIRSALKQVEGLSLDKKVEKLTLLLNLTDRVQKWGDKNVRRQNLITIQKLADAYVSGCNALNQFPTAAGFAAQCKKDMKDYVLKDLKGNAVKVVTYHTSKGLEWPVVILDNLDAQSNDPDIFGVNEKATGEEGENGLPKYDITIIPNFKGLSKPKVIEDKLVGNAFRQALIQKSRSESARLLYVGMTRARDYLIAYCTYKDLKNGWINKIGLKSTKKDYWGTGGKTEMAIDNVPAAAPAAEEKLYKFENKLDLDAKHTDKVLSPSSHLTDTQVEFKSEGLKDTDLDSGKVTIASVPKGGRLSALGTCIHKIFAAYRPEQEENNLKMAEREIGMHRFAETLQAEEVIRAVQELYRWLEGTYGKPRKILHELPFSMVYKENQILRGEMDLLWETEQGTVLVDFKNVNADNAEGTNLETIKQKYVTQMNAYTQVLEKADKKVLARLLFLPFQGKVLSV